METRRNFITNKQVADQLGVSIQTVQRMMNRGDLYYIWVGGRRKVTQELLDHFIGSRTTTGPLSSDDD